MSRGCFFAQNGAPGDCMGRLVRCHLIAKQRILREFPYGAWRMPDGSVVKVTRDDLHRVVELRGEGRVNVQRQKIIWDERVWVWGCIGHHGAFDFPGAGVVVRLTRSQIPEVTEEFAVEFGLEWSLEREYGPAIWRKWDGEAAADG